MGLADGLHGCAAQAGRGMELPLEKSLAVLMAFTVQDFHDLVTLVTQHPEWRAELRRLVLTEELLALPQIVTTWWKRSKRTEQQIAQLVGAQQHTEQQVAQLIPQVAQLTQQVAQFDSTSRAIDQQVAQLIPQVAQLTQQVAH